MNGFDDDFIYKMQRIEATEALIKEFEDADNQFFTLKDLLIKRREELKIIDKHET